MCSVMIGCPEIYLCFGWGWNPLFNPLLDVCIHKCAEFYINAYTWSMYFFIFIFACLPSCLHMTDRIRAPLPTVTWSTTERMPFHIFCTVVQSYSTHSPTLGVFARQSTSLAHSAGILLGPSFPFLLTNRLFVPLIGKDLLVWRSHPYSSQLISTGLKVGNPILLVICSEMSRLSSG